MCMSDGNELFVLDFKTWKKYYDSFVEAQIKQMDAILENGNMTDKMSEQLNNLQESILYNKEVIEKAKAVKDESIFYIEDGILGYRTVGRELKKFYEKKETEANIAYE